MHVSGLHTTCVSALLTCTDITCAINLANPLSGKTYLDLVNERACFHVVLSAHDQLRGQSVSASKMYRMQVSVCSRVLPVLLLPGAALLMLIKC